MVEKYENLDGMRAYACLGIIMMHVLANGDFGLSGFAFEKIIPSFTNFTYLFMILSAFSMCCGYFERFILGNINLELFYKRRFTRIWPFFAILCTIELLIEHNLNSLYEWIADITLAFGLIPNHNIQVVGVGWFLGVVFVFYMIFPYFVFLIKDKKRAWFALAVSIILNLLCGIRFTEANDRSMFIYSAMFFIMGGIIYIYRSKLIGRIQVLVFSIGTIVIAILIYTVYSSTYMYLILFSFLSIVGIASNGVVSKGLFKNRIARFLGGISMEMYLCHMFVYRLLEKIKVIHLFSNRIVGYIVVTIGTILGTIVLAFLLKKLISFIMKKTVKNGEVNESITSQ